MERGETTALLIRAREGSDEALNALRTLVERRTGPVAAEMLMTRASQHGGNSLRRMEKGIQGVGRRDGTRWTRSGWPNCEREA